ncbi:transferase [Streptomyces sp. NRRL F-4489]|nr:transferase [Streptomyces sp. NRRL F-4489]
MPRQSAGSDASTRHLLRLAGPLPPRPRVLDLGCGPGRSALVLAADTGGQVTGIDLHQPFLDELFAAAERRGLRDRITALNCSMGHPPFPDGAFDVLWAEGSAYAIGFDTALRNWRRLLAPGGVLVVTEAEWTGPDPSPQARAYWAEVYPLRTADRNIAAAEAAGYQVAAHWPLPESDWWDEYYTPLAQRLATADRTGPGMDQALAALDRELTLRREHGTDYRYAGYVLRPRTGSAPVPVHAPASALEDGMTMAAEADAATARTARPETPEDAAAIRAVNLAAFPTAGEADLVDALRADPDAWIDGLSLVAEAPDGTVAGHALLTRCRIGGRPALALAPCAVLPDHQRQGAGTAAVRAALAAARERGESLVVVLGHPGYYPRFGFAPASRFGIRAPFDVPDEALMALSLDASRPVPSGAIRYPAAFGEVSGG